MAGNIGCMLCGKPNVGFVSASRRPSSSAVSFTSSACTLSSSCASRRAPMMVEDTPGCACTQASATRATVLSCARAMASSASTTAKVFSLRNESDEGAAVGLHLARVRARVLAAERAALERRPGRDAEPELEGHRHQLLLDGALEQRVLDLQPDERRPAAEARGHVRLATFHAGVSETPM